MSNDSPDQSPRSSIVPRADRNADKNRARPNDPLSDEAVGQRSSSDEGMKIFASILAGIVCYGGLGWLADRALNSNWLMPIGMVVGLALSLYAIIRKYGSDS